MRMRKCCGKHGFQDLEIIRKLWLNNTLKKHFKGCINA
jgi:hypothetical protein